MQSLPSVIRRSSRRVETIEGVMGGDMRRQQAALFDVFGRYPTQRSVNGEGGDEDEFSDFLQQLLQRTGERLVRDYSRDVFENQSIISSRRGASSASQSYAELAQLIQLGINKNR